MAFTNYKSIADVLKSFPLSYQENDFIQNIHFECNNYFVSRLKTVVQEGIVFNGEGDEGKCNIFIILSRFKFLPLASFH